MAQITCAISGIRFATSYLNDISIPHSAGYFHPIFAVSHRQLYSLYSDHCKGKLHQTDSYLVFLAFLHSSGKIDWRAPAALSPSDSRTVKLVENNIRQLVAVLEKTALIKHPRFKQPNFKVTVDTAQLEQLPNWIKAWEDNIDRFSNSLADIRTHQELLTVENKLSLLITSGKHPREFSSAIADWADKAADFPAAKVDYWKRIIRSCFNIDKMFNTPLTDLKELKDYCECNIEAGSIHFHTLCEVLKEGISRHVDYLGGSSLALGYSILPNITGSTLQDIKIRDANIAKLQSIAADAPAEEPQKQDYTSASAYLQARLAWRVSLSNRKKEAREALLAKAESRKQERLQGTPTPTDNNVFKSNSDSIGDL